LRKGRFTVAIIREADRDSVSEVARRHGVSEEAIDTRRKRCGGFQAIEVRRLRQLEAENARLKKLIAERHLESINDHSASSCLGTGGPYKHSRGEPRNPGRPEFWPTIPADTRASIGSGVDGNQT
jgi:putative transposase